MVCVAVKRSCCEEILNKKVLSRDCPEPSPSTERDLDRDLHAADIQN
jgi:hypothetical protein